MAWAPRLHPVKTDDSTASHHNLDKWSSARYIHSPSNLKFNLTITLAMITVVSTVNKELSLSI